ncbi:hypothetical protein [Sphaerisporangium aureirubrum]|uniref:DUF3137 domain-containing protein n=1 Tax=Sphaerisporangium aureirubrum TaxID=1544736 RepID=A0ABW1NI81_9ACTN
MNGKIDHTATERKKRIKKYFAKSPDPADRAMALTCLAGAGVCAAFGLVGLAFSPPIAAVAFVVAAVAGIGGAVMKFSYDEAYAKAEPKPTDAEMDKLLADDLLKIERTAMTSLGLTAEDLETGENEWDPVKMLSRGATAQAPGRRPILVYGPSTHSGYTAGKDDVWRFQRYEVMVICPTHHHLAIYRSELDLLTGKLFLEQTQEYQYAHVASVSTITVAAPDDFELRRTDADPPEKSDSDEDDKRADQDDDDEVRYATIVFRQFAVGVSSGQNTSVTVGIFDQSDPEHGAHVPDLGIQQTIASIRRVLRDKNGGAVGSPPRGVYDGRG